jgi:hypothetical protein
MTPVKPTKSYMNLTQSRQAQIKDTGSNTDIPYEPKSDYQSVPLPQQTVPKRAGSAYSSRKRKPNVDALYKGIPSA